MDFEQRVRAEAEKGLHIARGCHGLAVSGEPLEVWVVDLAQMVSTDQAILDGICKEVFLDGVPEDIDKTLRRAWLGVDSLHRHITDSYPVEALQRCQIGGEVFSTSSPAQEWVVVDKVSDDIVGTLDLDFEGDHDYRAVVMSLHKWVAAN